MPITAEIPRKISGLYESLPPESKKELTKLLGYSRTDSLNRALRSPERLGFAKLEIIRDFINKTFKADRKPITTDELLQPII